MRDFRLSITGLILSLLPFIAEAQNLVPNPDFESYNSCPTSLSAIDYSPGYTSFPTVKDWVNPVYQSSPDYLNACASASAGIQTPYTLFGFQIPHSGDGYIGLNAWQGEYQAGNLITDYREYIQCKLTQPMQAGKKYCVSFFVSPSIDIFGNFNYVAIDEIGANFSTSQITAASGYTLNLPYHIKSQQSNYITDTGTWIKITGIYAANGNEQWMTIGCFKNGSGNIPSKVQAYPIPANTAFNKERAYFFIDDVSVVPISNNTTIVTYYDSSFCTWSALPMSLKSSAPGVDAEYSWNSGENSKNILVSSPGTYVCYTKANCQLYVDSFEVKFREDTKLNFKDFVNCNNDSIEIVPNKQFDTYQWSTGETTPTVIAKSSGLFILTATNRCGTQTDTAHVYIQSPTPSPIVSDTFICQLVANPQLNVTGENLTWYAHPSALVGIPVQPQIVTREIGRNIFYVTQTIGKCESEKVKVTAEIKYQPRHILDDKAVMCINDIKVIGKDVSGDVTYKWGTGPTECCIKPDFEGVHRVAISSPYCGTYVDSIRVVFSLCDTCIIVPNAFSPNGDNLNEEFKPIIICPVLDYHICVFNRWGRKIFEAINTNDGWDGRTDDILADNGIYVYTIEYRSASTNMKKFIKGNLTLIR